MIDISSGKIIIKYDDLGRMIVTHDDVDTLVNEACKKVSAAKYFPDMIIGISSGGLEPARITKRFLEEVYCKDKRFLVPVIGVSNYDENNNLLPKPKLTQTLDSKLETEVAKYKILLVDEVDDTRITLETTCDYLIGLKVPELNILVLHSKIKEKKGVLPENVKIYSGLDIPDVWVMYPWH